VITSQHEGLTKLTTLDLGHTAQVLRALFDLRIPETGEARLASPDMSEAVPAVCRADGALLYGEDGDKLGVIIETQRGQDDDKHYSWLEYIANFRAREKCQVVLTVICPDRQTARWAAKPVETGHPGLVLNPLVIGPDNTPLITDVAEALGNIGLAVISAVTKSQDPLIKEVLSTLEAALGKIDQKLAGRYGQYIYVSLTGVAQKEWGNLMAMQTHSYQGDFAESLLAEGEAKGEAKGKAEGKAEEGAKMLLEARSIEVSEEVRARITSCMDTAVLEEWFQRALTADCAERVFG
jgi:hypothetical protein